MEKTKERMVQVIEQARQDMKKFCNSQARQREFTQVDIDSMRENLAAIERSLVGVCYTKGYRKNE